MAYKFKPGDRIRRKPDEGSCAFVKAGGEYIVKGYSHLGALMLEGDHTGETYAEKKFELLVPLPPPCTPQELMDTLVDVFKFILTPDDPREGDIWVSRADPKCQYEIAKLYTLEVRYNDHYVPRIGQENRVAMNHLRGLGIPVLDLSFDQLFKNFYRRKI